MSAKDHTIDWLNSLLRGELAAIETYEQALAKFSKEPQAEDLQRLQAEHHDAVKKLRKHIRKCGGRPARSSGAWGTWAKLIEGAAKLLGTTAALKALEEGEEQGVSDYEKALQDETLPDECKHIIRDELLPQTQAHIRDLGRLMSMK